MQFRKCDTNKADGVYVEYERIETHDTHSSPYDYETENERIEQWKNDEWIYIGVQAQANITIVRNGIGTRYYICSAGLWGIESDSGEDYIEAVYQDEKDELQKDISQLREAIQ